MTGQRATTPLGGEDRRTLRAGGVPGDRHRFSRGFTLLELLAVVTIIALLAALLVGMAGYADRTAKVGRAKAEIALLAAEMARRFILSTGDVTARDVVDFLASVPVPVLEKPFELLTLENLAEEVRRAATEPAAAPPA